MMVVVVDSHKRLISQLRRAYLTGRYVAIDPSLWYT